MSDQPRDAALDYHCRPAPGKLALVMVDAQTPALVLGP